MDAGEHERLIAGVQEWFGARLAHQMSVKVHTGEHTVYVATGPFLRLEEHPVSKGVFRALFDDSLTTGPGPDAEKYIAFGSELQGATIEPDRLVLDKGSQTIEILDRSMPQHTRADEVTWPGAVAAPAPASVVAPVAVVAPVPPPPPTPVIAPPPPPAPAQMAAPVPAPAPQQTMVNPTVELRVKAPAWDNSLNGSKFSGIVTVRIGGGIMEVTGTRSHDSGKMFIAGGLILVFAVLGLILGLVIAASAETNSDMGMAFTCMGPSLLAAIFGLVLYFVGRGKVTNGTVETMRFNLSDAHGRKVRYDSNMGCLLSILFSPLVGIIVMLVRGRRIVRMTVPSEPGARVHVQNLVLKTLSAGDGAILEQTLRGW